MKPLSPDNYGVELEKEMDLPSGPPKGRDLLALEILTLAALIAIAFYCGWPLLEEWGLIHAFNVSGFGYVLSSVTHTIRPLDLLPYWLQWFLGGSRHIEGVAVAGALLLVVRYLVARWAVSPYLSGYDRWVVATMAAALAPWQGTWLGRFGPSQLAAVYFLLVLGGAIRLFRRWSFGWAALCALCVLLLLATYQGLFLCLAVLPLGFLFLRGGDQTEQTGLASPIRRVIRVYIAIGAGGVAYGVYWFVISHLLGGELYEQGLAAGADSVGALARIKAMFSTAYVHQTMALPLFAAVLCLMGWRAMEGIGERASRYRLVGLVSLCVVLLPLLGLIYVSPLHFHDPERINYPLSTGLVLLVTSMLIYFSARQLDSVGAFNASAVVLIVVVNCAAIAANIREDVVLQKAVLRQAVSLVDTYKPRSLIVRDETGELGDVYTLYQTLFGEALAVMGRENVAAGICTPLSVDRIHPVARRFPISSTPRCEDMPELKQPSPGVLVAQWNGTTLTAVTGK